MKKIPGTGNRGLGFLLKPIVVILLAAFMVRLIGITFPPISWRQADTAAMARNFFENRFNILYPQIDWGGLTSGYAETEFPIYPFVVASLYRLFGLHEFLGRLLSVAFFQVAIYYIYRLAREIWNEKCGLWAAIFFAFLPFQIHISQALMPEPLLMMCITAGVYYFYRWSKKPSWGTIIAAAIFLSMAILIKPANLYLLLPLGYLAWLRLRLQLLTSRQIWLFISILIVPAIFWYYHAHQLYTQTGLTFGIWGYGTDKWGNWGLPFSGEFWRIILWDHLAVPLAFFGVPIVIAGLLAKREKREEAFLDYWIIALLAYIVIVARGNFQHAYYLLPAMAPAALLMGMIYGKWLKGYRHWFDLKQILLLLSLGGMVVASAILFTGYFRESDPANSAKMKLGSYVQAHTSPHDLIVAIDDNDPTLLYLSHRKGWAPVSNAVQLPDLSRYKEWGARYVIGFNAAGPFMFDVNESPGSLKNLLPPNLT